MGRGKQKVKIEVEVNLYLSSRFWVRWLDCTVFNLIVIFKKVFIYPYIFLYYFAAIMALVRTRGRHLVHNFW
jgi:hypothetical protein